MTRTKRVLFMAAGAAVIIGVVFSGIGLSMLAKSGRNAGMKKIERNYSADQREVRLELDTADIQVYPAQGDEIILTYYDNERENYTVHAEGGVIAVTRAERKQWFEYLAVQFFDRSRACSVGIPAGYAGNLSLYTGTGDVEVSGVSLQKEMTVKAVTGDVQICSLSADKITAGITTGDIKVSDVRSASSLELAGVTGDLTVQDASSAGALNMKAHTGDICLKETSADAYDLKLTTGDITFDNIQIGSAAAIASTTGDIRGTIGDSRNNYRVESNTTFGDIQIPQSPAAGEKSIDVKTVTGDIRIAFSK